MKAPRLRRRRAAEISVPDAVGGGSIKLPRKAGSATRHIAEELSLAALIGGNLFGRFAMGPALAQISDKAERGKVLNRSWRQYGTINSVALGLLVASWVPNRRSELGALWTTRRDRAWILAKDITVTGVVVSGLASAATGVGFAHEAPGGAVPMDSGRDTAAGASGRATRLKQLVNTFGALSLGSEVALVAVNALLVQRRTRRLLKPR